MIVVNTKAYEEAIGKEALEIAKIMEKIGEKYGIEMVIAVQPTDIYLISSNSSIKVFSQHMDAIESGAYTGFISPLAIKRAGGKGSILNHSEHRMKIEDVAKCIEIGKKTGLTTIACAGNLAVTKSIACLTPDYVAIEPPELIGGDVSVSEAKPEIVRKAVEIVKGFGCKILCGAGIKKEGDVEKAVELGVDGILVASGVVKARNREKVLEEFARAMI
ncbi:MAG: triose-phosphate isomerase [Thermoplasmatales archaeon]|nr:triose-phosphate isomerase [Thermoplasmatales archaeon]